MSDDADRSGGPYAAGRESSDLVRTAGGAVFEFTATRWQRFVRPMSPVFEGAAIGVVGTAVSAALTASVGAGPLCYTLTALAIVSLYLKYRL